MQIGDWILIVNNTTSDLGDDLGSIEGVIINVTPKAIRVEWQVNSKNEPENFYRTWIPKSIIRVISKSSIKEDNQTVDYYGISIPSDFKLKVSSRIE